MSLESTPGLRQAFLELKTYEKRGRPYFRVVIWPYNPRLNCTGSIYAFRRSPCGRDKEKVWKRAFRIAKRWENRQERPV